ncbi:hypothetical protein SDC9_173336 [bioreactor metagenome]|uniref:Uncharacterized protein n=1 Tax=bioreactor metagenome TaxID=1076179 RepID=A0A645GGU6_9ZZZZ
MRGNRDGACTVRERNVTHRKMRQYLNGYAVLFRCGKNRGQLAVLNVAGRNVNTVPRSAKTRCNRSVERVEILGGFVKIVHGIKLVTHRKNCSRGRMLLRL